MHPNPKLLPSFLKVSRVLKGKAYELAVWFSRLC